MRWDRHVAGADVALGRRDDGLSVDPHDCAADAEDTVLRVDVAAEKRTTITYLLIMNPPSRETYERVSPVLDLEGKPPPGLLVHAALETEDAMTVVNVWESRETAEFERTRLLPALESAGVDTQAGPPRSQELDPFHVWIRNN